MKYALSILLLTFFFSASAQFTVNIRIPPDLDPDSCNLASFYDNGSLTGRMHPISWITAATNLQPFLEVVGSSGVDTAYFLGDDLIIITTGGDTLVNSYVHRTGNYTEDIDGTKTFTTEAYVPYTTYDSTTWEGNYSIPTKAAIQQIFENLSFTDSHIGNSDLTFDGDHTDDFDNHSLTWNNVLGFSINASGGFGFFNSNLLNDETYAIDGSGHTLHFDDFPGGGTNASDIFIGDDGIGLKDKTGRFYFDKNFAALPPVASAESLLALDTTTGYWKRINLSGLAGYGLSFTGTQYNVDTLNIATPYDLTQINSSNWTDTGSKIYPAENDTVDIPSVVTGGIGSNNGSGVLNVLGRLDLRTSLQSGNLSIGKLSLNSPSTSSDNTIVGCNSAFSNTTGGSNSGFGYQSLYTNQDGAVNTAIGYQSLYSNVSGFRNTALGANAGKNSLGSRNIFIGFNSGFNETGSDKLYIEPTGSATPLIYGNFASDSIIINGVLKATGNITGSNLSGTNTGDQDLSSYATTSALALKLNISDTASMLTHFVERGDTSNMLLHYIERGDTASMLTHFIERGDTASMLTHFIERGDTATMLSHFVERGDTSAMLTGYVRNSSNETIADVKTFTSDPIIPDEAYDATNWNGVLEPPTKNAVRDKIEALGAGYSDEQAQDAVGAMINTSLTYVDATPSLALTSRNINGTAFNGTANISVPSSAKPFTWDGNGGTVLIGSGVPWVVPTNCTVTGWSIAAVGTSPTATFDVWKIAAGTALPTVSNTIISGTKPALSTGNVVRSSTLSAFTDTTWDAGEIILINVDAVSNATILTFQLEFN